MKRLLAFILTITMLFSLCACGNASAPATTNPIDEVVETTEAKNIIEEILDIKSDDDPVDIYHSIMDFEGIGAEAYIENLKAENPENQYRYYNEKYYIQTITEGERKAALEQVKDVDAFFAEVFATDYPGMFIKAELNRNMDELTLHLNKDAYESNLFAGFTILIVGAAYIDSIQAYNLISPEKRAGHFVCVDENGEVLIDSDALDSSSDEAAAESTIAKAAYTLSDYVVVDNDECTFTIKSVNPNGSWGFTLNVFCENKTDKTLMFSWDKVSVMGFMVDPFWGTEVAAGKKANESISFSYDDLNAIGMNAVDEITFTLRVSDSEDWSADPILVEEYAIYPTGKSIQDIAYPTRVISDTEVILYDNDQFCVIVLSSETSDGDFLMHYYLENKTGHEIMFSMDEVSVNGYMADPFWGTSVAAGKKLYTAACFYESLLTDNGIEAVEEIEFTLRVSNADSWDTHAKESTMKTIESTLSQLTDISIVEDLKEVLREKDREFLPVEAKFQEAVLDLATRIGNQATQELVAAWDRQICSDLVYAGYLGFQANLHNFHNPVASQFTRLDYETFLREHIMQTMPYRNEAEAAAVAIQEAYMEALNEYEDAIRSYYVYLEVTGPKLAHFWGYRFANQFLPWVEPGYVSDGAQTSMYALELYRDLGFRVCT